MKGMDMVKVAVIILNWNGEKLLQKFLTITNYFLIVFQILWINILDLRY